MSEPPTISRRASAWWPAVVGLEQVMDAVTATHLSVDRGGAAPSASGVRAVSSVLRAASSTAAAAADASSAALYSAAGAIAPSSPSSSEALVGALPEEDALEAVTSAVRALIGVLADDEDRVPA
jgi:hypothetical protein